MWGLGCGVWGVGFGVWGLGCGVWGVGFGVWGLGCRVWGVGLRDFCYGRVRCCNMRIPRLAGYLCIVLMWS